MRAALSLGYAWRRSPPDTGNAFVVMQMHTRSTPATAPFSLCATVHWYSRPPIENLVAVVASDDAEGLDSLGNSSPSSTFTSASSVVFSIKILYHPTTCTSDMYSHAERPSVRSYTTHSAHQRI